MNVLVTGGAGFIGSHFVRAALADQLPGLEGAQVTVLDKLTYAGHFDNLAEVAHDKRLDFMPGDVADVALAATLVPRHDVIVHFAAETGVDRSIAGASGFAQTNVIGTQVLLDAALHSGTARFIHISTDAVYGSVETGASTERSPLSPTSPYAATKASADLLVLACHRTHGLPVTIVRASNTYGPHQFPEKLIPRSVTRLLTGRPVPLHGDGSQIREWLHVYDLNRAVALALTDGRPGEIYHVGGGVELSDRDLTALVLEACGAAWDSVETVPARAGHDRRHALDDDKIRQELGWRPRVEFDAGLNATVRWYRENAEWWRPLVAE